MTMHPGAVSTHDGSPRASWSRPAALGLLLAACLTAHAAPADEIPPPARQRAERLTFDPTVDRWIAAPEPIPGTEDGDLDIVRQYTAAEDFKTALKAVQRWVKLYGETAPRYSEALFLEGNAHLGLGDYRAASKAFQKLLDDYPGSPYAERALSAQFRIAEQYLAGKRRKAITITARRTVTLKSGDSRVRVKLSKAAKTAEDVLNKASEDAKRTTKAATEEAAPEAKAMTKKELETIRNTVEEELKEALEFARTSPVPEESALFEGLYV